jgi:nucleoside-diphosphate-sugar epimerase
MLLGKELPIIIFGRSMDRIKVFVTGATGTVGLYLVGYLASRDYQVVGLVRPTSQRELLEKIIQSHPNKISSVAADIKKIGHLSEDMAGCDVVVHTAAAVEPYSNWDELRQVNVQGTDNVLQAAINAGVKHFIHISSLSVITGDQDQFKVNEEQVPIYSRELYANSKIEAEKVALAHAADGHINVTILRPGFIYGPGERTWMPKLIQAMKKGRALLVGNTDKETNVIYVENLCRAIEASLLNAKTYGEIYNLTDGQPITKKVLFDTICDGLYLPRVTLIIPAFAAKLLVESASALTPFVPNYFKNKLALYSRAAYRLVAINQGFDISKAERDLKYVERIPFAEGMARTLSTWKT